MATSSTGTVIPFGPAQRAAQPDAVKVFNEPAEVTTALLMRLSALAGSSMIRRLRLISGLVMLANVTMHLLNHAVGLISLDAMEDVRWYIFRIWTNRTCILSRGILEASAIVFLCTISRCRVENVAETGL